MKNKFKKYRIDNKLSQVKVAEMLNIAQSSYSAYETGKNEPDIETLCTLADIYHTTVDDLIGREPPNVLHTNLMLPEEKTIIETIQQLSQINLVKVETYALARLEEQNSKKQD